MGGTAIIDAPLTRDYHLGTSVHCSALSHSQSLHIRTTWKNDSLATSTTNMTEPSSAPETQWHAVFPTPPFDTPRMSVETLAEMITQKVIGVDYIVVDVRRTDFEVSNAPHLHIRKDLIAPSISPPLSKARSIFQPIPFTLRSQLS